MTGDFVSNVAPFFHADKVGLYIKIYKALKSSGTYIEVGYMVMEQSLEDQFYAKNSRLRREMNIPDGEFHHFETPCTIDNQISMFAQTGFSTADIVFRMQTNSIIVTEK